MTETQPARPRIRRNPWGDAKGCLLWFGIIGGVGLAALLLIGYQMSQETNSLESSPAPYGEEVSTIVQQSGREALDESSDFHAIVQHTNTDCTLENDLPGTVIDLKAEVPVSEVGEVESALSRIEDYWRSEDLPVSVDDVALEPGSSPSLTGSAGGFLIAVRVESGLLVLEAESACVPL